MDEFLMHEHMNELLENKSKVSSLAIVLNTRQSVRRLSMLSGYDEGHEESKFEHSL